MDVKKLKKDVDELMKKVKELKKTREVKKQGDRNLVVDAIGEVYDDLKDLRNLVESEDYEEALRYCERIIDRMRAIRDVVNSLRWGW